jgi:hypothetical protein
MTDRIPFPVAVFIYNRADHAARISAAVARMPLSELYVVADGPKPTLEDRELCRRARAVVEDVDFPCPVRRLFAEHNMGSGSSMPLAIRTVLERSEAAIFLDDDCIPSDSFFRFCADLLRVFADDEKVMMISGVNPLGEWRSDRADYLFSKLGNAQAWATWRRAWRHFEFGMAGWADPAARAAVAEFVADPGQVAYWSRVFGHPIAERNWDYQWQFQRQRRHALCVVPSRNLVTHRGGDPRATHNKTATLLDHLADACELSFPLTGPRHAVPDHEFDRMVFESAIGPLSLASAKVIATRLIDRGQRARAAVLLRLVGREHQLDEEAGRLLAMAIGPARRPPGAHRR